MSGWKQSGAIPLGGVIAVGFAPHSDLVLVVSHSGVGVINCDTATVVARDRDAEFAFDESTREVEGIGPLSDLLIPVSGIIFGGTLPSRSSDGWILKSGSGMDALEVSKQDEVYVLGYSPTEVRAAGFSPSEDYLLVATGSEVVLFKRTT